MKRRRFAYALLLVLVASACSAPDRPSRLEVSGFEVQNTSDELLGLLVLRWHGVDYRLLNELPFTSPPLLLLPSGDTRHLPHPSPGDGVLFVLYLPAVDEPDVGTIRGVVARSDRELSEGVVQLAVEMFGV